MNKGICMLDHISTTSTSKSSKHHCNCPDASWYFRS